MQPSRTTTAHFPPIRIARSALGNSGGVPWLEVFATVLDLLL